MSFRRSAALLLPKLLAQPCGGVASCTHHHNAILHNLDAATVSGLRGFASAASTAVEVVKPSTAGPMTMTSKLSLTPSNKIVYNEVNHERFEPGTEGRPIAYFVRTGGRFLWASSIRLAVIKALVTLSAAADTLALGSLEVDLSGVEEGSTITVKWRGKPVFIQHRTAEQIESAAQVPLTDLKDPQKDSERTVDPKVSILAGDVELILLQASAQHQHG